MRFGIVMVCRNTMALGGPLGGSDGFHSHTATLSLASMTFTFRHQIWLAWADLPYSHTSNPFVYSICVKHRSVVTQGQYGWLGAPGCR
jgi:hypothetical protein